MEATDDAFWDQFWADTATSVQDVFALVPAAEIRAVREESPSNLATLCYKVRMALSSSVLCRQEVSLHESCGSQWGIGALLSPCTTYCTCLFPGDNCLASQLTTVLPLCCLLASDKQQFLN